MTVFITSSLNLYGLLAKHQIVYFLDEVIGELFYADKSGHSRTTEYVRFKNVFLISSQNHSELLDKHQIVYFLDEVISELFYTTLP